ncbi:MAG: symporter small accessory protein [Gemmatimonadota bacterium]
MLGLADGWVFLAYVLCILSSVLCVVYGVRNWDRDGETDGAEQTQWMKQETEIEKPL